MMRKMNIIADEIKSKRGDASISFAIGAFFTMILILIPIALFFMIMPWVSINSDLSVFSHSIRQNGYVSEEHMEQFIDLLGERGYSPDDIEEGLVVTAAYSSKHEDSFASTDLIERPGYTPLPVDRGDGFMVIELSLPIKNGLWKHITGGDGFNSYNFRRPIGSEYYSPAYTESGDSDG